MIRTAVAGSLAFFVVFSLALACVGAPVAAASNEPSSFDSVHYYVTVYENGSARWTFTYQTVLENESQRQSFRAYADRFESNDTDLYQSFRSRATDLVADGENVTGRNMSASRFSRAASVEGLNNNLGVIEMGFTWSGFAAVDGSRVVVGDLFDGGLYITSEQRFVITPGPTLDLASVTPTPDAMSGPTLAASDSVTWQGEQEFTDERPHVVFAPENATVGGEGSGDSPSLTGTPTPPESGAGAPLSLFVAGFVLAAVAGAGIATAYHRSRESGDTAPVTTVDEVEERDEPPQPAVTDAEMLTDEQRVKNLLEEHGGRMRQVSIVDETDWSKSKVSMLLSDMEDDDEITRLRVGRENVVSLPGSEPDAAQDSRP